MDLRRQKAVTLTTKTEVLVSEYGLGIQATKFSRQVWPTKSAALNQQTWQFNTKKCVLPYEIVSVFAGIKAATLFLHMGSSARCLPPEVLLSQNYNITNMSDWTARLKFQVLLPCDNALSLRFSSWEFTTSKEYLNPPKSGSSLFGLRLDLGGSLRPCNGTPESAWALSLAPIPGAANCWNTSGHQMREKTLFQSDHNHRWFLLH